MATPKDKTEKYIESVGRRKTAVARVRLTGGQGVIINNQELSRYFLLKKHQDNALAPFRELQIKKFKVEAKVKGGGISAQAEAVRHGLSRALVVMDGEFKSRLRLSGYLTRDSRMVERKKYGKKKARVSPQWSKR